VSERAVGALGSQDGELEDPDDPEHDDPDPEHDDPDPEHDDPEHDDPEHDDPEHDDPEHDDPEHDDPEHDDPDDDSDDDSDDGNRVVGGTPLAVLDFVVRSIVDEPESVVIEVDQRRGQLELIVSVAPSDTGKVIGRRGHVIQAIRTLVRAAGAQDGVDVSVEIAD
jgi:predicted RNA-binding protein YlqC (UPF0109 family)